MTLTRDAASEKFTTALRKDSDELQLQVQVRDGMQVYKPGGGCGAAVDSDTFLVLE